MTPSNHSVESASITDIGMKRNTNQDTHYTNDLAGLYILADGMGGHRGGDTASRLAVETIRDCFDPSSDKKTVYDIDSPIDVSLSKQANALIAGIFSANRAVFQKASENPRLKGMGTTVSSVLLTDETIIVANVGDSPVFLIRDHRIEPLYVSHSMNAGHQTDALSPERARHMLTRAVGIEDTVKIDSCEIQWFKDDIIVLCSDGLSNMVPAEQIKEIIEKEIPDAACRSLVSLANENGGDDNITIIVVKITSMRHNSRKNRSWFQRILHAFNQRNL